CKFFFFFSSRRRHTRFSRDWSSDVCSSDLIQSNIIQFHGRKAELVLANDITLKLYYIEAIESQNKKLQEIAWMQSHLVRAPLARIMGLVDLIQMGGSPDIDHDRLLRAIHESAVELDNVLGDITEKAEQVNLS